MKTSNSCNPVNHRRSLLLIAALLPLASFAGEYYLFTSFRGNGEDGLHLALSTNGYSWKALNDDRPFLRPQVGGRLMRDPCLAEEPDGVFHLVWTSGWTAERGKIFGYASSKDLLTWSEQRAISVMENEPRARNIWAPEIFCDQARSQWLIFWSSTVPGKFPATDQSGDDNYNHRIYSTSTKDFEKFSPTQLFFNPGFNVIDGTVLQAEGKFYLIFKDERKQPLKKNLRYAVADQAMGPFGPPSEPFTGDWVEGPSAIKIRDEYLVYFDHYAQPHYYGAVRSKDLRHWEDCSREMVFPKGQRHGTVLRVPEKIAQQLLARD